MVVHFLVVGFGLLMVFLVGSDVVGLWVFFFSLGLVAGGGGGI